jgi:hypothetical protein
MSSLAWFRFIACSIYPYRCIENATILVTQKQALECLHFETEGVVSALASSYFLIFLVRVMRRPARVKWIRPLVAFSFSLSWVLVLLCCGLYHTWHDTNVLFLF